jgi:membrane protease YdiL (CAAX protease family)
MDIAPSIPTIEPAAAVPAKTRLRWGPWTTAAWSVAILVVMVLSQTLGALAFWKLWQRLHPEQAISIEGLASNGAVLAFSVLVSAPAVLAVIALAVRLARAPLSDYLALKLPRWRDIGIGVTLLAAVLLTTGIIADLTGQETPAFIADTFNTARAAGLLPLLVFAFVILGPFQEEAMFRGFLFRGLAPSLGMWPTILITAGLWAIIHVQYQWFFMVEIFALGLVLGWLRAKSGSLLLTFGLHAFVNSMAVVEAYLMAGT